MKKKKLNATQLVVSCWADGAIFDVCNKHHWHSLNVLHVRMGDESLIIRLTPFIHFAKIRGYKLWKQMYNLTHIHNFLPSKYTAMREATKLWSANPGKNVTRNRLLGTKTVPIPSLYMRLLCTNEEEIHTVKTNTQNVHILRLKWLDALLIGHLRLNGWMITSKREKEEYNDFDWWWVFYGA